MIGALLLTLSALSQQPASAVGAAIRVDPDTALLGEPVQLTVSLTGVPADAEVIYPAPPDSGTLTALSTPRPIEREGTVRSAHYRVASWALGDLRLTLGEIVIVTATSELRVPAPTVVLHVRSALPTNADPDTLAWQPPQDVLGPNWSLGEKTAAIVLALAMLAITAAYVRRRGAPAPVPVPPARPPRARALEALQRLEESGLLAAGEYKAVYSEISGVVRRFLAETDSRWGLDLTSGELLPAMADGGVDAGRLTSLGGMLFATDMVKFAGAGSSAERAWQLLDSARLWIREFQRMPAGAVGATGHGSDAGEGEEARSEVGALMSDFLARLDAASTDDDEDAQGTVPKNSGGEESGR